MLLIAVGVIAARTTGTIPDTSALALVLHKPALAAIGAVVAHVFVQQAFPYIDGGTLLARALAPGGDRRDALLFAGVCVLRGLIYAAFILGVTLGL
jgi:hypothetical protein